MLLWLLIGCAREDLGHEYTEPIDILDAEGRVQARGWAREALFGFDRGAVPEAKADRVREWDFYTVYAPDFAVNVTLAEIRLNGTDLLLGGFDVHDYADGAFGPNLVALDDAGLLEFDPDPDAVYGVQFTTGSLHYGRVGDARTIAFDSGDDAGELTIGPRQGDAMALVTPYPGESEFFYEVKHPGMSATGAIDIGGRHWDVPEGSVAVMDFARGVMPGEVEWDWANGAGDVDGRRVGLNLGSVFGDEAGGTPNAVIVDGVLHKLGRVTWSYDTEDVEAPWRFASEEGDRVDLTLVSNGYAEVTDVDLGAYRAQLWKSYGTFEGTVRLDDGTRLVIGGLPGAAEHLDTTW